MKQSAIAENSPRFRRSLSVFLCHSSTDKPAVRDLHNRLRAESVDTWLDEDNLLPGQFWEKEIPKAVRQSHAVIVCLSRKTISKAGYFQKEIKYALEVADEQPEDATFLIPVRLEECEVPERLKHLQWVNLYDPDGFAKLMHALRDRAVFLGIADQANAVIDSAGLEETDERHFLEYELALARQIQASFQPQASPVVLGYDISTFWQPAWVVGGDFYDFIPLRDNRFAITIADVSDKGMAAALFVLLSRAALRTTSITTESAGEAVARANDVILADARSGMFETLFYGILNPQSNRFRYVNAGHNPPLLYSAKQKEGTTLRRTGMALGIMPNIKMQEREIELDPGDILFMYTDGVTDATNANMEDFGKDRLTNLLMANSHLSAEGLIDEISRAVLKFAGDAAKYDDMTMIVVKRVK